MRRLAIPVEHDLVRPAAFAEAAEAVRHLEARQRLRGRDLRRQPGDGGRGRLDGPRLGAVELLREVAVFPAQHRPRIGEEPALLVGAEEVAAEQEDAVLLAGVRGPRAALDELREEVVELLAVALRMLVEEDEVGSEALEAPVLLGLEGLPGEREVLDALETHRQDRKVP